MNEERVRQQYSDSEDLFSYLMENQEITYASYIDNVYKKILILSGASYFESVITEGIVSFSKKASPKDKRLTCFIKKKALKRQYHSLFDWDKNNSNRFWSFFGDDTKDFVRGYITTHPEMEQAEEDFMKLGNQRNLLVHENFANYDINVTRREIYDRYVSAERFVDFVLVILDPDYKVLLEENTVKTKGETIVESLLKEYGELSVKEIVAKTNKSESSVRRYVASLVDKGMIDVKKANGHHVYELKRNNDRSCS